jgi:hypothetical protein
MTNIQLPDVSVTMALVANLQASLPDFGRIVDQCGHPAPALRRLGLVHWENGRFDTAARTFAAALSLMRRKILTSGAIWQASTALPIATSRR